MKYKVGDKVKIVQHSLMVVDDDKLAEIIKDDMTVTISDINKYKENYEVEELKGFWFLERSLKSIERYEPHKSNLLNNPQIRFEILDIR